MAHAVTTEIRNHVLGDLLMVTGSFTDGGTEISLADHVSTVLACGGHATSITGTGVVINNGDLNGPAFTVDTFAAGVEDARKVLQIGQTIYNAAGLRLGVISALGATTVTVASASGAVVVDGQQLYVMGEHHASLGLLIEAAPNTTVNDLALVTVAHDTTNNLLIITAGSKLTTGINNAASVPTMDGRWWVLGKR
tara:strand:+ start:2679 stop:3263 length:585 start_codon:yes stop_codon:yes gene_type:complete